MQRSSKLLASIGLLFTTFFWALNAVIARGLVGEIPPLGLSFWRWTLVLLILLPISWRYLRRDWTELKKHWRWLAFLSIFCISAYNSLQYLAVQATTAVNTSLVNTLIPVVTLFMAWVILGQRPGRLQFIGILLAVAGMIVIITRGEISILTQFDFNPGDLIMFLAVLAWSTYSVLIKKRTINLHPLSLLTALVVLGLPWIFPFYLWELSIKGGFEITISNLMVLLYVALFASIFAYLLWNNGVGVIGPAGAAMFMYTMPVFAAILSIVWLDEKIRWYHYIGGLFTLAGLFLATLPTQRQVPQRHYGGIQAGENRQN